MKCTILGCGGSFGVPQIGCNCRVCVSKDLKNVRTRASICIESMVSEKLVLIDASTDLRAQCLSLGISKLDAVIFTHKHADHTAGIDDLKPFAYTYKDKLPVYMTAETYSSVSSTYGYLFESHSKLYRPLLKYNRIEEFDNIAIGDIKIDIFPQIHGDITSLGLICNDKLAYMTDFHALSSEVIEILRAKQLHTIIIDCLKYCPAPSHSFYEKTLYFVEQISPKAAYITHSSHEVDYNELSKILPKNVELAYDGKTIEII
jgi:phosphoribosyl 1,2-cyclic phosphate phosphodiesterase